MSYQPVVPLSGYTGWKFLSRTHDAQRAQFAGSAQLQRDLTYFRENIGDVTKAEDLVKNPRLLRVALGAFGLEADLPNRFFIRKVLDDGSIDPASLANRLSDKRYLELTKAFGFGDFDIPRTALSTFADEITERFIDQSFEVAVGQQNSDMRLALGFEREIATLANRDISETARWLTVMGSGPLRKVFDTAFGLPAAFATLDLDRQIEIYREKAQAQLGDATLAQFATEDARETLIQNFLARSDAQSGAGSTSGSVALQLLQTGLNLRF